MRETTIGKRFGRLVVLSDSTGHQHGYREVHCQCDCGNVFDTKEYIVKRGGCRSCGCLAKELSRERMTGTQIGVTHGASRNGKQSAEYMIWGGMIQRCVNPKHDKYYRYGGRGITVCQEWRESFSIFIRDMGLRPSRLHTIERKDNNGPYSADNCKWATRFEQARNTPRNRRLTLNGETMVLADWAIRLGLSQPALIHRLKDGWTVEQALSTNRVNTPFKKVKL